MVITRIADGVARQAEALRETLLAAPFEPAVRLGVTGLSGAGKTVFITSLVSNLLDRGRMAHLPAAAEGRILSAWLQPQPDDTLPRFDYEDHLAALTGPAPRWPEGTRRTSQLRLSLRLRPAGLLAGMSRPRRLHLDIVDYPGEWLLDLGLLGKDYATWSAEVLKRLERRTEPEARRFLQAARSMADAPGREEPAIARLAEGYVAWLRAARAAGASLLSPGRFLLPGDLAGSPVVTFAPLPRPDAPARRGLWREMERRFEAYKKRVVQPFFRQHFARTDRQLVLVDMLGAIAEGPQAVAEMRKAMSEILAVFRPGANPWLARLLRGRRLDRILFAATRADHLHHLQHPRLAAIAEALLRDARDRAAFAGAETAAMAIASVRATTEEMLHHGGRTLPAVRGRRIDDGRDVVLYPGELPEDPRELLAPVEAGAAGWLDADFRQMRFAPPRLALRPGQGLPHIRLDRAAEFLFGDRL